MRRIKVKYFCLIVFGFASCQFNSRQSNESSRSADQNWFAEGKWKQGWSPILDESVDLLEFKKQYIKNPERWEKAFLFLATTDLESIEPGKYKLEGDSLFANDDLYHTRDKKDTRFESHRRYADIQYLISGKEYIGVVPLSKMQEDTVSYSVENDIAFYESFKNNYHLADSSRFFIFFPDDAHRSCVKINNEVVKNRHEDSTGLNEKRSNNLIITI